MNNNQLGQTLLDAVRTQHFELTPDSMLAGAPTGQHPSIDLAVAAFPSGGEPVFANVLFSREHPQGLVAEIDARAGSVRNISYMADQLDAAGTSVAWVPGSDWQRISWKPLAGNGLARFVAPYPGSLVKLMVLVAVARLVDSGRAAWADLLRFESGERTVGDWAFDMTVISCNTSTSALVTLLHATGAVAKDEVQGLFGSLGLSTLRFANTKPNGGWRNADGAGVGQLQMTAWDSLRLLWLLDPDAPPAPWLPAPTPAILGESLAYVLHCLREQRLHEVLSSRAVRDLPGWIDGLPARVPGGADGELMFSHKTGNTENYCSDAGIVQGIAPARRHYLIALTSSLGSRYASHAAYKTTWRLPALGAAIDARLREFLGS